MRDLEEKVFIKSPIREVFVYADDHRNFSKHMNESSMMMGGSKMMIDLDEGKGQAVGSHIKMGGNVLGVELFLDEVVTIHDVPHHKEWKTVGDINLLVIGHYVLGYEIKEDKGGVIFRVYIHYDLPKSLKTRWLGILFADMYAKWCVRQMVKGVSDHFADKS